MALNFYELRELYKNRGSKPSIWPVLACLGLFIASLVLLAGCACAYTTEDAIHAIIGEAENQGIDGMQAVACAIRNRGTLKGVYGLHAPRVVKHKYSNATANKASVAWVYSMDIENCAYLQGATNWENINSYGKPAWAYKMRETYRLKDHVFYVRK